MKKRLLIIILMACAGSSAGQNLPAFRQFYFNPYLYNPAFAGASDYTEVSLFYRQQWVDFNHAPSAAGFTIQYPTQNRISIGMNFIAQEAATLRTTSAQATFAYRIPISTKQFIFFGLSGVAGYNDLNLEGVDYSNDPTILKAAATRFYGDANVGLIYQLSNLRVGIALPKLLGQDYYSPRDFVNVRYAQFRNQLYSVSYKFYSGYFSVEPYALYRVNRDFQNVWEAATLVSFKEKIRAGASYHNTQGLGFFLGMVFKEKMRFSYSYEVPLAKSEFISTRSHEVQLQLRLGKKRNFKWAAWFAETRPEVVEIDQVTQPSEPSAEPKQEAEEQKPEVTEAVSQVEPREEIAAETKETGDTTVTELTQPLVGDTLASGFYVIAGAFKDSTNARELKEQLTESGYEGVKFGIRPSDGRYYVYLFASRDMEQCRRAVLRFRNREATRNAWILRVP